MTTKLSQRRIKSTDPAYATLKEQLLSRRQGGTGGYDMPIGGIPRTDLTDEIQRTLELAQSAYQRPGNGIAINDLDASVQDALNKASKSYPKPDTGIPIEDLDAELQARLSDLSSFYVMPDTGMPEVDMDSDVRATLVKARSAYQKPAMGIPKADLGEAERTSLGKADTAYQKPTAGIPLTDLATPVAKVSDLIPYQAHVNDASKHITDHKKLTNIGVNSHEQLDNAILSHTRILTDLTNEIIDARGKFISLGSMIESSLGKNTIYRVDEKFEWDRGTYNNLRSNEDGNISFGFTPETIRVDVYDTKDQEAMLPSNRKGGIYFTESMSINRGTGAWLEPGDGLTRAGVRTTFYVYAPKSGKYNFSMLWSGRGRMMVAGNLLFEDYIAYSSTNAVPRTGEIYLEGGRMYPVVVEGWYYGNGDRILALHWRRPDRTLSETIPLEFVNIGGYGVGVEGVYESNVIDFKDSSISQWFLTTDMLDWWDEDDATVEISTSVDGSTFSSWTLIDKDGEITVTPERFVKLRFHVYKQYGQYTPLLRSFEIRYISSTNDAYHKEIVDARDTYLALKDRFDNLERYLEDLGKLQLQFNASNIHPEYFVSVRFAAVELNLLRYMFNMAASKGQYELLADGFVDHFATTDFIDITRSGAFNAKPGELSQRSNATVYTTSEDWMRFTRDRLEFTDGSLRLALNGLSNGKVADSIVNTTPWSYGTEAYLAQNSPYSRMLAQPFYVREFTGAIKKLSVYVASATNSMEVRVLLCASNAQGLPDTASILWGSSSANLSTGNHVFDNLYISVIPGRKYFILVQSTVISNSSANRVFFQTPNTTMTSARLRTDNPEKKALFMNYAGADGVWKTSPYFLNCQIDEVTEYETEGTGVYIEDYRQPTKFLSAEYDITNGGNGLLGIQFSSSPDQATWSSWTSEIRDVPSARFLRTKVYMSRATEGYFAPVVNEIRVGFAGVSPEIISKGFRLGHTPTHVLLITDQPQGQHLRFMASRDDGETWTEVLPEAMTSLSDCRPGNDLRIKVIFDGNHPTDYLKGWGVQGIYHREITSQNIVALHEEYIATSGQRVFRLKDTYPMGEKALEVYVNGIYQSSGRDYNEIDEYTIEFIEPLIGEDVTGMGADVVTFRVSVGAYDIHDQSLVQRIDKIDDFHKQYMKPNTVEYVYDTNGRLEQEVFSGIGYHVVDYTYTPEGKQRTITTTTDKTITVEEFEYNADGTVKKKTQTVSEVSP